ncbi:MAG: amidohydrolase family protein [Bryobacteraceae bacterium]|nr:amidohydrolase family protein [Bryobacteraceae bacterium]
MDRRSFVTATGALAFTNCAEAPKPPTAATPPPTAIIDSHHHFWMYSAKEYGWISDKMPAIQRDFLPVHLAQTLQESGVNGAISVQARQTLAETRFLLKHANENEFLRGVVGWVPLIDANVGKSLAEFAGDRKLKGVRHVLHDEKDDTYMLRPDFNRGIQQLKDWKLRYDILIFEKHLPQTLRFVDQHPDQIFIVDHIAKPKIKTHEMEPWKKYLLELAKRPRVYCKLSGMVTEADWEKWTPADLQPYIDTVLAAFGPRRIMYGSDWPVCLLASPYKKWFDTVTAAIARLSETERARILGGTAIEAYNL